MSNVIPFAPIYRRNSEEENKRYRKVAKDAGSHAWANLIKTKKLKNKADRIAIAQALYKELQTLREMHPELRLGEFAGNAGLSAGRTSRDLHRYMLPPTPDNISREKQARDLRASTEGYILFLEAIQRITKENIAILADRVTWATSLHPRQVKDVEESEKLLSSLQEAINRIDHSFPDLSGQAETLYTVFMQTAKIKVEMRKNGSLLRWPYFDGDVPFADLSPHDFPQYSPYSMCLEDEIDERYAYWHHDYESHESIGRHDYPSSLSHYKSITNLPRIYLGLIVNWKQWGIDDATAKTAYREKLHKHVGKIVELRDENTNLVRLVYRNPETGKIGDPLDQSPFDEDCHAWLIIYPSPDNRSLAPVIYRPNQEGGVELIYLNLRNFVSLKNMEFISESDPISLYERIKELIGFGSGRFEIEEAWKATAPDVLENPILRAHREKCQREHAFSSHLENWWNANEKEQRRN